MFGKEVAQKDFFSLQKQAKLLKPASLNQLLRKRNWKLEQIPEPQNPKNSLSKQSTTKKKKRTGSRSFGEEFTKTETQPQEFNQRSKTNSLDPEITIDDFQTEHDRFNKQVKIGRPDRKELANSENIWDYMAYNLGKKLTIFQKQNYESISRFLN